MNFRSLSFGVAIGLCVVSNTAFAADCLNKGAKLPKGLQFDFFFEDVECQDIEDNGLFRVVKNHAEDQRVGMVNRQGKVIIPAIYRNVGELSDGLRFVVDEHDRLGYVDNSGNIVIKMQYVQPSISDSSFVNGMAVVAKNHVRNTSEVYNKVGVINKSGKVIIPFEYDELKYVPSVHWFLAKKNEKYGYIDLNNKTTIPFMYDELKAYKNGYAIAGIKKANAPYYKNITIDDEEKESIAYGIIDLKNEEIIPIANDVVGNFSEGLALVGWKQMGVSPEESHADSRFSYGYFDEKSQLAIAFEHTLNHVTPIDNLEFSEGMVAYAKISDPWSEDSYYDIGYMDNKGNKIIPAKYHGGFYEPSGNIFARAFSQGLVAVVDDSEKYGFLDKTGKTVIGFKFDNASDFGKGDVPCGKFTNIDGTKYAGVMSGGKVYAIDKTGKKIPNHQVIYKHLCFD